MQKNISFFSLTAIRFGRFGRHFLKINRFSLPQWLWETVVLVLEIIFLGEIYTFLNKIIKPNMRQLTERERVLAQSVFGESLNYNAIWIDDRAQIGCRKGGFAYVSFRIINVWGAMKDAHLIHELTHVWQYERLGARYMPRALQAQNSRMGYNYGGLQRLKDNAAKGLRAFNMEQQADIVTDYFLVKNGKRAQWSEATKADLGVYEIYVKEIQV
jgi:hypothetical protein